MELMTDQKVFASRSVALAPLTCSCWKRSSKDAGWKPSKTCLNMLLRTDCCDASFVVIFLKEVLIGKHFQHVPSRCNLSRRCMQSAFKQQRKTNSKPEIIRQSALFALDSGIPMLYRRHSKPYNICRN